MAFCTALVHKCWKLYHIVVASKAMKAKGTIKGKEGNNGPETAIAAYIYVDYVSLLAISILQ
jgi:hypothetical protein